MDTTVGKQVPLGSERLKICELFAEILHLQYLFTSSPLFDSLIHATRSDPPTTGVVDGLIEFTAALVDENVMTVCIVPVLNSRHCFLNSNGTISSIPWSMI